VAYESADAAPARSNRDQVHHHGHRCGADDDNEKRLGQAIVSLQETNHGWTWTFNSLRADSLKPWAAMAGSCEASGWLRNSRSTRFSAIIDDTDRAMAGMAWRRWRRLLSARQQRAGTPSSGMAADCFNRLFLRSAPVIEAADHVVGR